MGCVSSKNLKNTESPSPTPRLHRSDSAFRGGVNINNLYGGSGKLEKIKEESENERDIQESVSQLSKSKRKGPAALGKRSAFSFKIGRLTQGEHVAAGWPAWLSAVAGETVEGWLPLRSDLFEKLDKIGQGTYSSVYRARYIETGKMVALKKVRFNNMKPESVRFMAREITILRRLDHPNIMKLEGIIASPLSTNLYLVFEYMEHDLAGLLSNPEIRFSGAQIKCYMWQLLCGMEHCHSHGVIHRDIKTSNILVNNEGILKIADFGLANFSMTENRQPLTNRVVTLWYRPPELLLGSTSYKETVDMWSVGCVFAELFLGRPLLKGRNEVEQLHKIFKLCGTPPDEYWKRSKLPLATMFKPQNPYESTLRERCSEFPRTAVNLLETFLSVEPHKRGTASSALDSEYFSTRPYACDPSSLPKYQPNKEIDAKLRDHARRKRAPGASRNPRKVRKPLQESTTFFSLVPTEEVGNKTYDASRNNAGHTHSKGVRVTESLRSRKPSNDDTVSAVSQVSEVSDLSQADSTHSVPAISNSFVYAKRRKQDLEPSRLGRKKMSRSQTLISIESMDSMEWQQSDYSEHDFVDSSQELPVDYYNDQYSRRPFSLPLTKTGDIDENQDSHLQHAVQKSRFYRDE